MNPTGTEARVCADIAARQQLGIAKYGTTVQDNPLGLLQWLEHAYQECLDQAVYLKRAMELLQGVDARCAKDTSPTPCNPTKLEDPHAELRATWREGQRWQYRYPGMSWHNMADVHNGAWLSPAWDRNHEYRRHPEDKDADPTPPADPHAALKAIYQPGMRYRTRGMNESSGKWGPWLGKGLPSWISGMIYEIHPDDLPKPQPKEDGWITVPDDCMEMPEGLKREDQIVVRFRSGEVDLHATQAGSWHWKMRKNDASRVVAYRIIKPAE